MDLVVSYGQIHLSLVASTVRFPALQVSRLILLYLLSDLERHVHY